jgi:hypothetical protein
LNGNQRLMYCGLLRPIHGNEFEPVWFRPQVPGCGPQKKKPRCEAGLP